MLVKGAPEGQLSSGEMDFANIAWFWLQTMASGVLLAFWRLQLYPNDPVTPHVCFEQNSYGPTWSPGLTRMVMYEFCLAVWGLKSFDTCNKFILPVQIYTYRYCSGLGLHLILHCPGLRHVEVHLWFVFLFISCLFLFILKPFFNHFFCITITIDLENRAGRLLWNAAPEDTTFERYRQRARTWCLAWDCINAKRLYICRCLVRMVVILWFY